jgi:beta-fructofuranosidase
MNEPLKNDDPLWNGCFSLPRKLSIEDGKLIQQPVDRLKELRKEPFTLDPSELPVEGPTTAYYVVEGFTGNQYELKLELKLQYASFCGLNLLCNVEGEGGLAITWSGDVLNVDGVIVPVKEWKKDDPLSLQIFVDKKFVEVFVNGGRYSVTLMVREENIGGDHIALSSLGGTGRLVSFRAWKLNSPENNK